MEQGPIVVPPQNGQFFMAKKPFEWPEYPCPGCGFEKQWLVGKAKNSGGHNVCVFYCGHCSHRTTHFVACKSAKDAGIEPEEIRTNWKLPDCEVCGKKGAENHHWAPYALFGCESEKWPRSYLCQPGRVGSAFLPTGFDSNGGQTMKLFAHHTT